ncbi:MAG TPA: methyltransferase domain-containing protein [Dokdonella sp.]
MNPAPDDYLERVKAEIRSEAERARERAPLPRVEIAVARAEAAAADGIERERRDYAIGELTGPDHRAFVERAFRALLKRPADEAGAERQIALLAAGAAKAEVLGDLRWSPEGRRLGVRVHGLLPRYLLAKLSRVPLLGYCVDWALALAGLPMLLRHQRAADASIAARFEDVARVHAEAAQRFDAHAAAQEQRWEEQDRRNAAVAEDIRRALLRVDALERRATALEEHTHDLAALRHYVHAINHWVVSLQRSLDALERAANAERARADAFAASVAESAADAAARQRRHAAWSAALKQRLGDGARVLDLGSGAGAWLEALLGAALAATGVETNRALAERALARGLPVAHGEPADALARCDDAALDGVALAAALLADVGAAEALLTHAHRALRPGGVLLLRVEPEPPLAPGAPIDAARAAALLAAAGFADPLALTESDGAAVLARRPAP